jgi:hypothetical protein
MKTAVQNNEQQQNYVNENPNKEARGRDDNLPVKGICCENRIYLSLKQNVNKR